jgi:hypothetical protein
LTKEFEIREQRNKSECHFSSEVKFARYKPHTTSTTQQNPFSTPREEAIKAGEIGEGELDELEEKSEIDYQIGEGIRHLGESAPRLIFFLFAFPTHLTAVYAHL